MHKDWLEEKRAADYENLVNAALKQDRILAKHEDLLRGLKAVSALVGTLSSLGVIGSSVYISIHNVSKPELERLFTALEAFGLETEKWTSTDHAPVKNRDYKQEFRGLTITVCAYFGDKCTLVETTELKEVKSYKMECSDD